MRNLLFLSFLGLFSISAWAHDHINLHRNIPVHLEDAYPTAYMNREILGYTRYVETKDNEDHYVFSPILEYGIIRNGEVELEFPVRWGSNEASDSGSGDIIVGGLYNFFYEGWYLPAPALTAHATLPTGEDSEGIDTRLGFILTKTLSRSTYLHRLHFNAYWYNNDEVQTSERTSFYEFALGYQLRLGPNNVVLLNAVQRQEKMQDIDATVLEAGIRHQFNPLWILAAGVGVGVSPDAPQMTATLAFQHATNLFWDAP